MIPLPRLKCVAAVSHEPPNFAGIQFLQEACGRDAWRTTVASCLLCRTRRAQAEPCFAALLSRWPTAGDLARSDTDELKAILRPLGLQHNRARQLQRLSTMWHTESWDDLRDLPGVGEYVADAVGAFVFGCLDIECSDHALLQFVAKEMERERETSESEAG